MVAVVDDTVTTEELKRLHALGVRGIRFNLAQAGATTPEMMEPLSKRVNDLGWHIQINASGGQDHGGHADSRARALADRLRPSGPHPAARRRQRSALRQGAGADGQGPHVGEAVGRLRRYQGGAADLRRLERGGARVRQGDARAVRVGQRLAASDRAVQAAAGRRGAVRSPHRLGARREDAHSHPGGEPGRRSTTSRRARR